jgi:hypothetical protein
VNAESVESAEPVLPLWRLIAGIAVFAALIAVLASLTPVYLENFRLQQYLRDVVRASGALGTSDDAVRGEVLGRAHALNLPVSGDEIEITHLQGKIRLDIKYAVQMHLTLYQVDLHFHPSAQS